MNKFTFPTTAAMIHAIKSYLAGKNKADLLTPPAEAYNLWSDSYDDQPGNLMLDLDEIIFTDLLQDVDLFNKTVADIGCGTGRHWKKIYAASPAMVIGYDLSEGMLKQLKLKFPQAITSHIKDDLLADTETSSVDCIISTLTIAHIKNLEETVATWSRVLKSGGDIILTDFHPDTLAKGGKRTFRHGKKQMAVVNYVHSLAEIKSVCNKYGLTVYRQEEKFIDDSVRSWYENQQAMHVFDKYRGTAIIYGLHLKKEHAAD